jgi:hypothetical protein
VGEPLSVSSIDRTAEKMIVNCLVLLSFLAAAFSADIPAEWQVKIDAYNAFFGNDDTGKLDLTGYPVGLYLVSCF